MYTNQPPARPSPAEGSSTAKDIQHQKHLDNFIAVGLLGSEPRPSVKKKRNVEFKEKSTTDPAANDSLIQFVFYD